MKKNEFLYLVSQTLVENPEWWSDTIRAMDHGLANSLQRERIKSSYLANAVCMLSTEAPKTTMKYRDIIQQGLQIAYHFFFKTAPIGEKMEQFLLEDYDLNEYLKRDIITHFCEITEP